MKSEGRSESVVKVNLTINYLFMLISVRISNYACGKFGEHEICVSAWRNSRATLVHP